MKIVVEALKQMEKRNYKKDKNRNKRQLKETKI